MKKADRITFDIETYRTRCAAFAEEIRKEALEKRPAANTRKDIKTEWDTAAAREARANEALAKTALDPLMAEVLIVSSLSDGDMQSFTAWGGDDDRDHGEIEGQMLLEVAQYWENIAGPDTWWVGHNIGGFDLPVMLGAFRRHGITPPKHFPRFQKGRWFGRVYDSMQQAPNNNGGFVSLDTLSKSLGLPSAKSVTWMGEPMTGKRVALAYENQQYTLLEKYCEADVEAEDAVFCRMTFDGAWGLGGRNEDAAAAIAEVNADSQLTDIQKKVTIYNILDAAGLIPRVA